MDGVYDERGFLDIERTKNYVSNEAVLSLRRDSPKVLFGASVNPKRRDWKDELDRCLADGAVLLKWLPNVMGFDPVDPTIAAFYERLVETGTPLLSHVGFEYSLPVINDRFSDLERIIPALEAGVTVIAAHCGGGRILIDSDAMYQKLQEMVTRYPNLYLDVSAMASIHRKQRFLRSITDSVVKDRLLFGTDFPIPVHPMAFRKWTGKMKLPENDFAKDIAIKVAVGLESSALTRGAQAIGERRMNAHCACMGCTPFSALGLTRE
jgi:predicted TIM-barrel fold metal-dependent hydrolase